jgi:hypothetical protein
MNTPHNLKQIVAAAMLSGGFGSGRFGTGHRYRLCMAVRAVSMVSRACHTYHKVGPNQGNVGPCVWDGPNPPAPPRAPPAPPLWVP